jgi:hypothetical protein
MVLEFKAEQTHKVALTVATVKEKQRAAAGFRASIRL